MFNYQNLILQIHMELHAVCSNRPQWGIYLYGCCSFAHGRFRKSYTDLFTRTCVTWLTVDCKCAWVVVQLQSLLSMAGSFIP